MLDVLNINPPPLKYLLQQQSICGTCSKRKATSFHLCTVQSVYSHSPHYIFIWTCTFTYALPTHTHTSTNKCMHTSTRPHTHTHTHSTRTLTHLLICLPKCLLLAGQLPPPSLHYTAHSDIWTASEERQPSVLLCPCGETPQ